MGHCCLYNTIAITVSSSSDDGNDDGEASISFHEESDAKGIRIRI